MCKSESSSRVAKEWSDERSDDRSSSSLEHAFRRQQVAIDDSYCHDAKMVGAHICEFKFQGRLITLIWSVG